MQGEKERLIHVGDVAFTLDQLNYENSNAIQCMISAGIFICREVNGRLSYPESEMPLLPYFSTPQSFRPVLALMLPLARALEPFEVMALKRLAKDIYNRFLLQSASMHPHVLMVAGVDTLLVELCDDGWHAGRFSQAIAHGFQLPRVEFKNLCPVPTPKQQEV